MYRHQCVQGILGNISVKVCLWIINTPNASEMCITILNRLSNYEPDIDIQYTFVMYLIHKQFGYKVPWS